MKYRISACIALGVLLAAGTVWAHHSRTVVFDVNQRFTRTGTLTKVDWRNPHIYFSVEAKNDQGQMETWLFEGPAPVVLRNMHVGKIDFENAIGKAVKVEANRARDGSLKGLMWIITLPDGKAVSLCQENC